MSRAVTLVSLLVATILVSIAWAPVAGAQDATPAARLGAPNPSECTIAPRPAAFFEQFTGTPTSEQEAARMAEATPPPDFQMPEGAPADEATVQAVLETVWQLGACVNAGDFFGRYAALFTEESLQRQFQESGPLTAEDLTMLAATPTALPEEARVSLLAVEEVRLLPDGRVAGLFQVYDPFAEEPGPARFYWVFEESEGRWLIDEEIMLGPLTAGMEGATPAP